MRPILLAGAVVVDDERLLLVRRRSPPAAGLWSLPVAEVAPGEPLVAAVVRSVDEGAGLEAVCEHLLGHVEQIGEGHRVVLAFGATLLGDDRLAADADWVGLDDVPERPLVDGVAELLADLGIIRLIA